MKRNTFFDRTSHIASSCALVGLLAAAPACSSSDSGTPDGGNTGATATFSDIYTTIINPQCVTCHDASTKAGNLDMSTQTAAFSNLVGVVASGPSCASTNEDRVKAGSPSQSVLYSKLSMSVPVCGSPMPLGGPVLTTAQLALVSDWITSGAAND